MNPPAPNPAAPPLKLFSVIIPARDEEGCVASMVKHLNLELRQQKIPHEIVVVDDGSSDKSWEILTKLKNQIPELNPCQNSAPHGFGRAVVRGLDFSRGDAVVIMMADESDDARDAVKYWR
ncbi:MAG TPA: glycosyltransferase family 2 protein, partial [Verrucomicrobiae bacterium]